MLESLKVTIFWALKYCFHGLASQATVAAPIATATYSKQWLEPPAQGGPFGQYDQVQHNSNTTKSITNNVNIIQDHLMGHAHLMWTLDGALYIYVICTQTRSINTLHMNYMWSLALSEGRLCFVTR